MSDPVRILGIDPGFDRTGFGVIDQRGSDPTWLAHGCIQTNAQMTFAERLQMVRDELKRLIESHQPQCVAVEQLFFSNNAKTAINVGMARGVVILTIADAGIPIVEHMCNLGALPPNGFKFFAVPVKVKGMGTFPVRAFAIR